MDGETIRCAKRTSFLTEEELETFFGAGRLLERYRDRLNSLYDSIEGDVVVVFGELLGGYYPHPDVPVDSNSSKVQKGVWYTNVNEFYAFDIMVDGEYLDAISALVELNVNGFTFAKILFRGSYFECLEFEETFESTIPKLYGMPPIEDNKAEGVIIKPVEPRFLAGGSRVILKKKTKAFSEKQAKTKVNVELEPELKTQADEMLSLINENRLRNVLSKIGPVGEKDFGKVMQALVQDYTEDFLKDNPGFTELEKADRKKVSGIANKSAALLIRTNFLDIIDGTF